MLPYSGEGCCRMLTTHALQISWFLFSSFRVSSSQGSATKLLNQCSQAIAKIATGLTLNTKPKQNKNTQRGLITCNHIQVAPQLIKLETKPEGKKPNTLFLPPGVKIVILCGQVIKIRKRSKKWSGGLKPAALPYQQIF